MNYNPFRAAALLFFTVFISSVPAQPAGDELIRTMFSASKKVETLSYRMRKTERINGKMITQISNVKLDRAPYRVYTQQNYPNNGLEVLFVEGSNDNKAIVNPNSFPWINLNLDPYGSIMRKDQHHTIYDAGYDHFISILEFLVNKYGSEAGEMIRLTEAEKEGKELWEITFTNPNYKYLSYSATGSESVHSIAKRKYLNSYTILERNPGLDHASILPKGKVITIPNDYSPKMILLIDKQTNLPVQITVFDEKGLFEQFEFSNVIINPSFDSTEFSTEHPRYNF